MFPLQRQSVNNDHFPYIFLFAVKIISLLSFPLFLNVTLSDRYNSFYRPYKWSPIIFHLKNCFTFGWNGSYSFGGAGIPQPYCLVTWSTDHLVRVFRMPTQLIYWTTMASKRVIFDLQCSKVIESWTASNQTTSNKNKMSSCYVTAGSRCWRHEMDKEIPLVLWYYCFTNGLTTTTIMNYFWQIPINHSVYQSKVHLLIVKEPTHCFQISCIPSPFKLNLMTKLTPKERAIHIVSPQHHHK